MMKQRTAKSIQAFVSIALLMVVMCPPALVFGQEARGTIGGTVRDTNQGLIPEASVKVNNLARGISVVLKTNDAGLFRAPFLVPGAYQVVVEAKGFKKYVRDGVDLRIGETLDINVALEPGGAEESVTVTAAGPELQTTTASMGQAIDGRRVSELPLVHGDPYTLIALAPGASFARDPRLDRPFEPTHIVGYSMDGTRANRSDLTIDGVPSTSTANAFEVIASYVPPADAIQEFKIQTATFDAQFGNTEGGVTSISIKSGTNSFHGTGYFWEEPAGISANDFFGNANKQGRPDSFSNRWGGSLGGPVWIPKLYDGRNKTFAFWAYEGIRDARPRNNGTPTTASEAMLRGDFSELLKLGSAYQIYNPFTRRAIANGRFQEDPFPNNIIPLNLINPVAKSLVEKYWPKPTSASLAAADGTGNFRQPNLQERAKYSTNTIRIDQNIGSKHRIFGRGSWYDRVSDYNNYFDNLATGEVFLFRSRQGALDEVWTINPTTVLNLRYGYNRFIRGTQTNLDNHGFDLTSVGFPSSYNSSIPEDKRRFPAIDITGYQGTRQNEEFRPTDLHSAIATLNKAVGAHSFNTGVEFRGYRETDSFAINDVTGRFNFDATWTRGPIDNSATAPGSLGQSFAAFLLGLPTTTNSYVARLADYAEQSTTWGYYFQDDWKVTQRLTLNMGLRYEYETPLTERYNRSVSGFDDTYNQPFQAAAQAAFAASQGNPATATPEVTTFKVPGALLFATPDERDLYKTPRHNFAPRLGIAYQINDKTVVRAGYGIFYGFLGQRRGDVVQSGFSQNTPFIPTQNNGLTFIATLSNPFPNGIQEPVGSAAGPQTFLGQSITYFNQRPLAPRNQRFQIGFQRELPGGFFVEAAYVGNRASGIEINRNINVTPQKYLSTSPTRDQAKFNYLTALVPNPLRGLLPASAGGAFTGTTIARERLMRPFPEFDAVNTTTNDGYSRYDGLQIRVERRFSKGYTVGGSYTYSRFTQATELLNQDDLYPTEVVSDQDFPHRFSLSAIYELPFGSGHRFLTGAHAAVSKIVSGWQVQGVYAYQSGTPLTWGNIIFNGNIRDIQLPKDKRSVERWFNTDAGFEKVAANQLDHNVRTFPLRFDFLRGISGNNFDLSLVKNTTITENTRLQLRFEATNALNHAGFPAANTTPTAATFGQITASNQANYPRRIQLGIKYIF